MRAYQFDKRTTLGQYHPARNATIHITGWLEQNTPTKLPIEYPRDFIKSDFGLLFYFIFMFERPGTISMKRKNIPFIFRHRLIDLMLNFRVWLERTKANTWARPFLFFQEKHVPYVYWVASRRRQVADGCRLDYKHDERYEKTSGRVGSILSIINHDSLVEEVL